jgi:hypothetical protein
MFNDDNSIKFDYNILKDHPEYSVLLSRAELYVSTLVGHIPDASSKHITDKMEAAYLKELCKLSPEDFCRYQTCRIYYFLRKVAFKRLDLFELNWDLDDCGRYWLVGCRVFSVCDDLDEQQLAHKIDLRTKQTNEYLMPLMEMLTEKVQFKLRLVAFEHFASILDIVDTISLPQTTTINILLPDSHNIDILVAMARRSNEAKEQGDSFDPSKEEHWQTWLDEVYDVLYSKTIPDSRIPEMHGHQFNKHVEKVKAEYSKMIISRYPSLSYIFSKKNENAYKKAKERKQNKHSPTVLFNSQKNSRSMASLNSSGIFTGSSVESKILGFGKRDSAIEPQDSNDSKAQSVNYRY